MSAPAARALGARSLETAGFGDVCASQVPPKFELRDRLTRSTRVGSRRPELCRLTQGTTSVCTAQAATRGSVVNLTHAGSRLAPLSRAECEGKNHISRRHAPINRPVTAKQQVLGINRLLTNFSEGPSPQICNLST